MENDIDAELEKAYVELGKAAKHMPPWFRKHNPYIRRQIAQSRALLEGDRSEAGVEKQLQLMDKEDQEAEVWKAVVVEKSYQLVGWFLMLVGIGTMLVSTIIFNYIPISMFGLVTLFVGFMLNRKGVKKQSQRLENPLPED